MLRSIINFQTSMRIILIIVYLQIVGFCCAQTFAPVLVNTKWVNENRGAVRYLEFEKDSWEISRIARRKKILFSILEYLTERKIQLIIKEPHRQVSKYSYLCRDET